jgi:hypothetical protein
MVRKDYRFVQQGGERSTGKSQIDTKVSCSVIVFAFSKRQSRIVEWPSSAKPSFLFGKSQPNKRVAPG